MSAAAALRTPDPAGGPILCLGEAIVDFVCERPVTEESEADAFVPHFGGVVANIALLTARAGARVALAGGAGEDAWGRWLRGRLLDGGVDVTRFELVPGRATLLALAIVDDAGEARYRLLGETSGAVLEAVSGREEAVVAEAAAVLLSSNTLVDRTEREVTMRVRESALARGLPVVFDPNLRLHRWSTRADAAASANACVPGCLLVRANALEAQVMTGEDDVERAAVALLKAGARNVVITLGERGAMLRGRIRVDVPGVPARVLSTIGAGDAVTATLLARLSAAGFYEPAIAAGLREAVVAAAAACERWGAVD